MCLKKSNFVKKFFGKITKKYCIFLKMMYNIYKDPWHKYQENVKRGCATTQPLFLLKPLKEQVYNSFYPYAQFVK